MTKRKKEEVSGKEGPTYTRWGNNNDYKNKKRKHRKRVGWAGGGREGSLFKKTCSQENRGRPRREVRRDARGPP